MKKYICIINQAKDCGNAMFTPGVSYKVVSAEGNTDIVLDNYGHKRCLVRGDETKFVVGSIPATSDKFERALYAYFNGV